MARRQGGRVDINKLFGNQTAAQCLLFLARYEEGTSGEISNAFNVPKTMIYLQLRKLEDAGVLVGRRLANIRLYSFNPRSGLKKELKNLLERYIEIYMPQEKFKNFYLVRRRPRKAGKPLRGVYEK